VYLRPKWAKENGRAVVLASGQVEGMLRMNNQSSFMVEDLVCVYAKKDFAKTSLSAAGNT
jgi:hypothetical protein